MGKFFLQSQEVAGILDVSRSQLQNLTPNIPHLYISSLKSRLWPREYVLAYRDYLRESISPPIAATSREFVVTSDAKALIRSIKKEFNNRLSAKAVLSPKEVAVLFSVAETTVAGWRNKRALPGTANEVKTKRDRGKQPKYIFTYTQDELRRFVEWQGFLP